MVLAAACAGDPNVRKQEFLESGNRYFDQGRYREAVIEYRNAVQIDARFAAVRVRLGEAYVELGDVANATSEFVRAADLLPRDVDVQLKAAQLLVASARPDDARARAEAALAEDPDNARAHILLGTALAGLKDIEGALAEVEEAIRLARLYLSQSKLDLARQEFDALAAKQERPVAALTMAGVILQMEGQAAAARDRFERALAFDATAGVAANNLAWILAESGERLDLAVQLARTAVASMPESPEARDTLGWAYYKSGSGQLAVSAFERSVEQRPESPVYHYHLGLACRQAGDSPRARQALERALELSGDFAGADDARRVLSELGGGGAGEM